MFLRFVVIALAAAALWMPAHAHAAAAFDPHQATEAYLAQVAGEARAKSDAYFEGGYVLDAVSAGLNILAALLILFTGMSRRMRDMAERITGLRGVHIFLYTAMFLVLSTVLTFGFDYYRGFVREHAYGLANQNFPDWFSEYAISAVISVIALSLLATIIYAIIRRSPQGWWLWAAGASTIFFAIVITVGPVFVAPLFNKYASMAEGPLKDQILSLARANGVPATDVYQFDASKQTKKVSANVSGLFGTTRISLNDNLLNRATPSEVRFVMGHEMGHYVLNHGYKFLFMIAVILTVIFGLVAGMFTASLRAIGGGLGLRDQADPAALPLLVALVGLLAYLATPVFNTMIRVQEAEADMFGLNATREPDGFANATLKLSEYRKLDPTPWEEFIFYDHPSGRSRISMAMRWKAENLNALPPQEPAPAPTPAEPSTAQPAPATP